MFTKTIIAAATGLLATLGAAAPTYPTAPHTASITLIDAVNNEWTVSAPCDQSWFPTNVKESISHVRINNPGNFPCNFFGVNGLVIASLPGTSKYTDVGPPQTIVGGVCGPWISD